MKIIIDIDDVVAAEVFAAVKAETRTALTSLDAIIVDWLRQMAKRAAVHAAENAAAGVALLAFEATKAGKIAVGK